MDAKRIAILGVSRLGKTVMWAGPAHDPRIGMVIASCSGEGGAALSRRNYGETIAHLTAPSRYPYQFAEEQRRKGCAWASQTGSGKVGSKGERIGAGVPVHLHDRPPSVESCDLGVSIFRGPRSTCVS